MSPENIPPPPENNSTTKKTTIQKPPQPPLPPPQDPPQKCPRCDSSNTKFCYYNNYSLTQPRHFCKTCRRYWTRGGALRNVPVGGGCRKPAKSHRLKLPNKPGLISPEFHLGGISPPRLHPATAGVYTQYVTGCGPGNGGGAYFGLDLFGPNYQGATTSSSLVGGNENQNQNQITISSIESLSSINQEMHWKLQAQRLGLFYGQDENNNNNEENNKKGDQDKILFNNNVEANNGNLHGVWGDLDLRQNNHVENNHLQVHQFHGLQ